MIDEIAHLFRKIVAADHDQQLGAVLEDQLSGAFQRFFRLEFGIERNDVDQEPPVTNLYAALGIDPLLPDQAPVIPRLGPRLQFSGERSQEADRNLFLCLDSQSRHCQRKRRP